MTRSVLALIALAALLTGCARTSRPRPGIITTVAGDGWCRKTSDCDCVGRYAGDGGLATRASLNLPEAVAVSKDGIVYIADTANQRIRKVNPAGIITTIAGDGWSRQDEFGGRVGRYAGDGGPATKASLNQPTGLAIGPDGSLFVADTGNNRIRKINQAGIITTIAGKGRHGYSGDGGPATKARLSLPKGLAVAADGTLFIADMFNHRIRRVSARGLITTVAGGGSPRDRLGDGGPAAKGMLYGPEAVALDGRGDLYVADVGNRRIRKVSRNGIITTIAGAGGAMKHWSGEGGPAAGAPLMAPGGIAVAPDGSMFTADAGSHCIRKVDPKGAITTVAGDGWSSGDFLGGRFAGDGGDAIDASLNWLDGIALGLDGGLYIADTANNRIRKVTGAAPPPSR